jgi:DNA-binding transcriptional LysR family regulator
VIEARKAEHGDAGTIRIGFVSTAGITILPDAIKKLQDEIPSAEIEMRELAAGEQIDGLYREHLDIGFLHTKLTEHVLETMVIARERLVLAVPETCKEARSRRIDLKNLASWTAIMPVQHTSSGFYEHVQMAYQMAGVTPERIHYTRFLMTGLLLVGAGLGVSIVPESFKSIHVKGVVYKELLIEPPMCELVAAWRRDNASPLLHRFLDELRSRTAPK